MYQVKATLHLFFAVFQYFDIFSAIDIKTMQTLYQGKTDILYVKPIIHIQIYININEFIGNVYGFLGFSL